MSVENRNVFVWRGFRDYLVSTHITEGRYQVPGIVTMTEEYS